MRHGPNLHQYEPTPLWVIPLLIAGLVVGCSGSGRTPPPHTPIDLSAPKPAALTFLRAIQNADPAAAKAASIDTDQQRRWIDAYTTLIGAMRRYDQALTSRFGQQAAGMDAQLKQGLVTMTEDPITGVEGGTVQQDERSGTAQVLPGMRG